MTMLGLVALGCDGGEPARPATGAASAVAESSSSSGGGSSSSVDAATAALLARLEKTPSQVLRAIAVLRPGPQAKAQAIAALKAAGAGTVQDLGAQPMLVIEVNAAQLRAVVASGQVLRVQADTPAPTN